MSSSKWWQTITTIKTTTSKSHYHTIQAIPREITGTRVSIKDRAQGRIPAVRSVARKHLLTTERRQIQSILKEIDLHYFCSTKFPIQIRAGSGSTSLLESGNVLPIKVHRDPKTGKLLNLVFVWADEGTELKVDVPVVFKGEDVCPGLKKGGVLNKLRTSLKYKCPSEHIPQKIEVDISNLDIGDRVFMQDVKVHPSLELLSKNETLPVCKIVAAMLDSSKPTQ